MSSHSFRHFHSNRLPDPHLTPLGRLFPHRSPRQSSANAACGRFRASPRRAAPKGHNLHLPRSTTSRSPTYSSSSPRSWHTITATTSRSASEYRIGTQRLTVSAARRSSSRHPSPQRGRNASISTRLPTFHAEAADQARAAYIPDTTWPVSGLPPGSSRTHSIAPVLMSYKPFGTSSAVYLRSPS